MVATPDSFCRVAVLPEMPMMLMLIVVAAAAMVVVEMTVTVVEK
jgi:hypothetical protein